MQTLKRPVTWIGLFALVVTMGTVFVPQSADAWGVPFPPLPPKPPKNEKGSWNDLFRICNCPVDIANGCICAIRTFGQATLSSW